MWVLARVGGATNLHGGRGSLGGRRIAACCHCKPLLISPVFPPLPTFSGFLIGFMLCNIAIGAASLQVCGTSKRAQAVNIRLLHLVEQSLYPVPTIIVPERAEEGGHRARLQET